MKRVITKRALIQRIRRAVRKQGMMFMTSRRYAEREAYGDYFHVDLNNHVCGPIVHDIEEYGRDLGVLKPWECVGD